MALRVGVAQTEAQNRKGSGWAGPRAVRPLWVAEARHVLRHVLLPEQAKLLRNKRPFEARHSEDSRALRVEKQIVCTTSCLRLSNVRA